MDLKIEELLKTVLACQFASDYFAKLAAFVNRAKNLKCDAYLREHSLAPIKW